jgi:hypothetical protein
VSSDSNGHDGLPRIPVSWGELVDKVTILEIKARRLTSEAGRANVRKELDLLGAILAGAVAARVSDLKDRLTAVNERLWDIEDSIRVKESRGEFDDGFIRLARSVYIENDERAAIKREINVLLSSQLVEEKSYAPYRQGKG